MITICCALYLFIGLDNVLETPNCGSGFWCCWESKLINLLFWPVQFLNGLYQFFWNLYEVRKELKAYKKEQHLD
jgi:hypothetical protein